MSELFLSKNLVTLGDGSCATGDTRGRENQEKDGGEVGGKGRNSATPFCWFSIRRFCRVTPSSWTVLHRTGVFRCSVHSKRGWKYTFSKFYRYLNSRKHETKLMALDILMPTSRVAIDHWPCNTWRDQASLSSLNIYSFLFLSCGNDGHPVAIYCNHLFSLSLWSNYWHKHKNPN